MSNKSLPHANKGDLTKGPVGKHLVRLSVPMIWGIGAIISFQLVDTYFISLLGTKELAAISYTFPVNYFIFSFTMGFGIAMSSVLSRLIGAGDEATVKRVATHGLLLVLGVGTTIAVLGMLLHDKIFTAMGADAEMLAMIRDYMMIWFAGSIFVTLPLVGNAAIRATGDSVSPAIIMGVAALTNVILDPLLIFGLYGFPRLELWGAALATVIANALAALAGLYVIYVHKKLICTLSLRNLSNFGDSAKRLLFIALPAGLTNAIMPIVSAITVGLISAYGAEAVAAYGVVNRIEAFAFIILMAVSVGLAPIIGQNWGAQKFDRVHETLRLAIGFNVAWSALVALILFIFGEPLAGLFSDNPEVIAASVLFFTIVPFSYAFSNLVNGWASAFNAMGMPQRSVIMTVVKMVILMIPAIYIGKAYGGLTGIFIAIALVNTISGIVFHLWCTHSCRQCEKDQ